MQVQSKTCPASTAPIPFDQAITPSRRDPLRPVAYDIALAQENREHPSLITTRANPSDTPTYARPAARPQPSESTPAAAIAPTKPGSIAVTPDAPSPRRDLAPALRRVYERERIPARRFVDLFV